MARGGHVCPHGYHGAAGPLAGAKTADDFGHAVADLLRGLRGFDQLALMFIALILLGFGWAGTYGASGIMIKEVVADQARFRAQGRNEMLVSLLSGLGAVSAGPLLKAIDWQAMNLISVFLALWLLPLILLNRSKP